MEKSLHTSIRQEKENQTFTNSFPFFRSFFFLGGGQNMLCRKNIPSCPRNEHAKYCIRDVLRTLHRFFLQEHKMHWPRERLSPPDEQAECCWWSRDAPFWRTSCIEQPLSSWFCSTSSPRGARTAGVSAALSRPSPAGTPTSSSSWSTSITARTCSRTSISRECHPSSSSKAEG